MSSTTAFSLIAIRATLCGVKADSSVQLWHAFHRHLRDNDRVLRRVLDRMPVPLLVVCPVAAEGHVCRWIVVGANRAAADRLDLDAAGMLGHTLEEALDEKAAAAAAVALRESGTPDAAVAPDAAPARSEGTGWRAFAVDGCRAGLLASV